MYQTLEPFTDGIDPSNLLVCKSCQGDRDDLTRFESNTSEQFHEANIWAEHAEDALIQGIQRLTTLAEDEHKLDPSNTVKHYFSTRLAKLIKASKVEFDKKYLD